MQQTAYFVDLILFSAGGIFSPLNDNTTGRSSSGLSPRAVNSYSPYIEQRNNSGQVPIDYNRINSQVSCTPQPLYMYNTVAGVQRRNLVS